MLISSKPLFFTLFIALTLLVVFTPAADANTNVEAHRRQANRMIKKRADPLAPLIGVGADPNDPSAASSATSTTSASSAAATTSSSAADKTTSATTSSVRIAISPMKGR